MVPLADSGGNQPVPLNFREGMGRLAIVLGVLGCIAGGVGGYFLAMHARATSTGFVGESVLADYAIASSLPVIGFLVSWGGIHVLVWVWAGFTEQPNVRGQGQAAGR
jgi:hypothetical protein